MGRKGHVCVRVWEIGVGLGMEMGHVCCDDVFVGAA